MLKFTISDQEVELYANTRIKVRFNNPAFDDKLQTGSYTLPFNIPASPANQKTFSFLNQPSSRVGAEGVEAKMWLGGMVFARGIWYVNSCSATEYGCDFALDTGAFTNILGDTTLQGLDHDTISLERDLAYQYAFRYFFQTTSPNEYDYTADECIMRLVRMDSTYTTVLQTYTETETKFSETNASNSEELRKAEWLQIFAKKINEGVGSKVYNTHSAGFYMSFEHTSSNLLYLGIEVVYVAGSVTSQIFNTSVETINLLSIENGEIADVVFPYIKNANFYKSNQAVDKQNNKYENNVFEGAINDYVTQNGGNLWLKHNLLPARYGQEPDTWYDSSYYNVVPFVRIGYVFNKICLHTNYELLGDFLDDTELQQLVIANMYALDQITGGVPAVGINSYADSIHYANHLPGMKVKDFMLSVASLFNFYYSFDVRENVGKLVFRQDLLTAAITDWTEKFGIDFEKTLQEPRAYTLEYNSSALPSGYDFQEANIGAYPKKEQKTFDCGTLPSVVIDEIFFKASYGADNAVGNSPASMYNLGTDNAYPLRLCFWRANYYTAGSHAYAANAYSLKIDGAKGIAEKFHKKWLEFLQKTRIIKKKAIFNVLDMYKIDLNKRYAIDYQLYLIKSIEIEVSNGKVTLPSLADVELAQIIQ